MTTVLTRREFAVLTGASLLAGPTGAQTEPLLMRAIPSSGERVPAVGLGTARIFDTADETSRSKAAAVVRALIANGGRIIDTASTYGDAEIVMGDEIATSGLGDKIFIATKVEIRTATYSSTSPGRSHHQRTDQRYHDGHHACLW